MAEKTPLTPGAAKRPFDTLNPNSATVDMRENVSLIRAVAENVEVGLYVYEIDQQRISYVSPAYERIWGQSASEIYADPAAFLRDIHSDDRPQVEIAMKHQRAGENTETRYRLVLPGGGIRHIHDRSFLTRGPGDDTLHVFGIAEDVTETTDARFKLASIAATYEAIVRNNPFGVYVVGSDFKMLHVSLGTIGVFGGIDPLIGRDFAEIVRILWPEPFATEVIGKFRQTLETGEFYIDHGVVEKRQNIDRTEAYEWRIDRITLPDGTFGVVCHFFDLSARKALEEQLRQAVANNPTSSLAAIMATSLDGVVATDEHGTVIGWNANAEAMFGYTAQEALQQPMDELIIPANTRAAHNHGMNRYVTTGVVHILGSRVKVTALHKEGHEFPVELAVMITSTVGSKCFVAFIRDLTAEIAAKDKIEILQNELLHLNRLNAMGTAAAMIAHELNQPLAAAKNYLSGCQRLMQSGNSQDENLDFAINNAQDAINTADGIVKQVRAIVSQQPVERNPYELKALLNNAIRLIGSSLPCRPIYELGRSAKIVTVNRGEIEQVLLNLIRNAGEAVSERPDPMIICSSKRIGDLVAICVRDNGAGLSVTAQENLFTAFKSAKEDGLGLGLSICRAIVEQRGGKIWVESDNVGTTVTFTVAAA